MEGGTDVLVGIKVEIGSIEAADEEYGPELNEEEGGESDGLQDLRRRDRGRVVCNVEWLV
jgi:hypothetical protein